MSPLELYERMQGVYRHRQRKDVVRLVRVIKETGLAQHILFHSGSGRNYWQVVWGARGQSFFLPVTENTAVGIRFELMTLYQQGKKS